jgi:hypothetical protein
LNIQTDRMVYRMVKYIRQHIIKRRDRNTNKSFFMIAAGFAGALLITGGIFFTISPKADTQTTASLQAENGTRSGNVTIVTDGGASNGSAIQFGQQAEDSANLPGWGAPVFRDEFTYKNAEGQPAVDLTKWNIRDRSDLGLLFDAAIPDKNQVSVDDGGVLHIKADWLSEPQDRPVGQSGPRLTHKTGYMDHRPLRAGNVSVLQHYGRWEIRAKMPTGDNTLGALSAFWLRSSVPGEIDIVEAWGYKGATPTSNGQFPGSSTLTIHSNTSGPGSSGYQKKFWRVNEQLNDYSNMSWSYITNNLPITPAFTSFRTWAFEYTPTYLAGYYEGKRYAYTTPDETPWLWDPANFGQPFHVRLNLHVGPDATYWGYPDWNNKQWTQPLDYQVDYVRIWAYNQ